MGYDYRLMATPHRLHDAVAEIRVRFRESGYTQEFIARVKAEKFTPMVVNFHRDQVARKEDPGGVITVESRGPIVIARTVVPELAADACVEIERWIIQKRRSLEKSAAAALENGATGVKITSDGKVNPIKG